MNVKRIFSIIVILVGIAMVGGAYYIRDQVAQGKLEISSGERQINQTESLFSANPASKMVGDEVTKSGREKIAAGNQEISYYENMARNLQIGGFVLIVLGVAFFFFSGRRK
ncbi:MAG: hypothetical protein ACHQUC_08385 [Chlamydiales bacterium]